MRRDERREGKREERRRDERRGERGREGEKRGDEGRGDEKGKGGSDKTRTCAEGVRKMEYILQPTRDLRCENI